MTSNTRFTVAIEGQGVQYFDNVHAAIMTAQRAVYAGPSETTRALDDLKAGRIAEWAYGFSAVRIYPPDTYHPVATNDLHVAATNALDLLRSISEIMKTSEYYDGVVLELERALKA